MLVFMGVLLGEKIVTHYDCYLTDDFEPCGVGWLLQKLALNQMLQAHPRIEVILEVAVVVPEGTCEYVTLSFDGITEVYGFSHTFTGRVVGQVVIGGLTIADGTSFRLDLMEGSKHTIATPSDCGYLTFLP